MTGTSLPGARSSHARESGRGRRASGNARIGIVDQRFDHIDNGRLPRTGVRAYVRVASATCTSRPHTPHNAHSRTPVEVPSSNGTSDVPCVRCAGVTPNASQIVAFRSTVVVSALHVRGATPGHAINNG